MFQEVSAVDRCRSQGYGEVGEQEVGTVQHRTCLRICPGHLLQAVNDIDGRSGARIPVREADDL